MPTSRRLLAVSVLFSVAASGCAPPRQTIEPDQSVMVQDFTLPPLAIDQAPPMLDVLPSAHPSMPIVVNGPGAGTGGNIVFATGSTDAGGQINVATGAAPAGAFAVIGTISRSSGASRPAAGFMVISPANPATAVLSGANQVYVDYSGTDFELKTGSVALAPTTIYVWNYIISDGT